MKRIITDKILTDIQIDLNKGMSYPQLAKKYNTCRSNITKYISKGLLIKPNRRNINQYSMGNKMSNETREKIKKSMVGKRLSEETKKKISIARIEYLNKNPDKVPYLLNHSSKISYPERIFKKALESSGIIGWAFKYQMGIYQYDFAFVNLKLDVEIDGGTHLTEKVKSIDKRRDEFSQSNGWIVIRFTAKEIKNDLVGCINRLKSYLK